MNIIEAIFIIEEDMEATGSQVLEAYQFLVDSGAIHHMQGSLQRTAHELIEAGYIVPC
jgi:hypothetical protein